MAVTTPVNSGYTIINGSTTGSNGSKVNTWLEYKVTQNINANTSTIDVYFYSQATTSLSTEHDITREFGYVAVDSTKHYKSLDGYSFKNKQRIEWAHSSFTVTHNSDGTKTVTISGAWSDNNWSSYITSGSASASVSLPQIPRASTVSSLSVALGSSGTITVTKASSSFYHELSYSFQGLSGTIGSRTQSTSITFTPPSSFLAKITGTSATGTITCATYTSSSGGSPIGTKTSTLTVSILKATIANTSATMGSSKTISVNNRYSDSSMYVTITYAFGNLSNQAFGSRTNTNSVTSTFPLSLATQIPNAVSGTGTITISTSHYIGGNYVNIGSNTYTLTLTVPDSVKATANLTLSKNNTNTVVSHWNVWLQGFTKVNASLTTSTSGSGGATVKGVAISGYGINVSGTGTSLSATSSSALGSSAQTYTGTVTDSRGRTGTDTKTATPLAYAQPSVNNFSVVRCNTDGTLSDSGTSIKVSFTSSFASVNNLNRCRFTLQRKLSTASSWTDCGVLATHTATNTSYSQVYTDTSNPFLANANYNVRLVIQDGATISNTWTTLTTTYSTIINIPTDERVLNVNGSGSGLAIGGFSTEAGKLQVYYPADFEGSTLPTINEKNYISYYTDTHISATNYNSIEAFYDALPSSVQTSVWCETATDRPWASGGMVTVFKEDNSYGYVVFHGTDGHYFTKRKTGGVWQSWITLMIGSLNGTNLTTSYSMTGNIAMGDISRFLTAKTYTTSSASYYDDYFNFAKALCDDWVAKDTGTYVAKISWANVTWGIAIILVQQNTYITFEWLSPYDTIIRGQLWNNTYTATLFKQRGDLIQATGTNISVPANTWTTICSITLPAGTASLVGSVLNLPASNTWNNGDLVSARFSGQDFVRTSCHPWGNNTGQASMCFTEHVINNSQITVTLQIWSSKAFTFTGTGRLQASMRSRWTTGN